MSWLTPLLGILGVIGLIVLIIIYIIKPNYQNKIISSTYVWKIYQILGVNPPRHTPFLLI